MSMSNLSVDGEFRYIIQWFHEWSELQRDDFVYVLVEYLTNVGDGGGGGGGVYVNGVANSLASSGVQDKPMSLFQCRIKLFREWSPKWPIEFKCKLQEKINEIDANVGEKIINELKGPTGHNGDVAVHLHVNGSSGDNELEVEQEMEHTVAATADTTAQNQASENDNHLAEVLRQETPVDDVDAGADGNADINGHYVSAPAAVTTIAVNASPQSPTSSPSPPSPQPIVVVEPVEQVESNNVTVSSEVPPVA
ncbi:uncharacterized protein [Drosophila tropicalis]|uniref:uncharacterized protein n=1 Tax=Drosophila tropicalis TaxID=46794 RepID=UPI0035AC00CC